MEDARDPIKDCATAVRDGLRQIGDFSYAILPKDIAHALGDLKKSFLAEVRNFLDREIGWIDRWYDGRAARWYAEAQVSTRPVSVRERLGGSLEVPDRWRGLRQRDARPHTQQHATDQ